MNLLGDACGPNLNCMNPIDSLILLGKLRLRSLCATPSQRHRRIAPAYLPNGRIMAIMEGQCAIGQLARIYFPGLGAYSMILISLNAHSYI